MEWLRFMINLYVEIEEEIGTFINQIDSEISNRKN